MRGGMRRGTPRAPRRGAPAPCRVGPDHVPALPRFADHWRWLNARVMPWVSLASGVALAVLWREGVDGVRAAFVLASLFGAVTLLVIFPPSRRRTREPGRSRNAPWALLLLGLAVGSCFDLVLREQLLRRPAAAALFLGPVALATLQLFPPVLSGLAPRQTSWAAGRSRHPRPGLRDGPSRRRRRRQPSARGRGRPGGGYRLWGPVPVPASGAVEARVLTEGGQLVGRVTARVDAGASPAPPTAAPP